MGLDARKTGVLSKPVMVTPPSHLSLSSNGNRSNISSYNNHRDEQMDRHIRQTQDQGDHSSSRNSRQARSSRSNRTPSLSRDQTSSGTGATERVSAIPERPGQPAKKNQDVTAVVEAAADQGVGKRAGRTNKKKAAPIWSSSHPPNSPYCLVLS